MTMTVGQLKEQISTIPDDAQVFGYVGEDGILIQAERVSGNPADFDACAILRVPAAKPVGGGPAE